MKTNQTSMDMIEQSNNTVVISSDCGHGLSHIAEKIEHSVETKYCPKCKRILPTTDFAKCSHSKDGLQDRCKECKNQYQKERYYKNKEAKMSKKRVDAEPKVKLDKVSESKVVVDEKERTMLRVYSDSELAKFTPRQLMAELKARGFRWEYMLEPQKKIYFDKI